MGESSDNISKRIIISDSIRCCGENKVIGRLSGWENTGIGRGESNGPAPSCGAQVRIHRGFRHASKY